MQQLKSKLAETLIVGNNFQDIEIGNTLGCITSWIDRGNYPKYEPKETEEPDFVIHSLSDLLEILPEKKTSLFAYNFYSIPMP